MEITYMNSIEYVNFICQNTDGPIISHEKSNARIPGPLY